MSFVGHGWRSGQAGDAAVGNNSTATVGSLSPTSGSRNAGSIVLTVTGTGFTNTTTILANYSAIPTQYISTTQVRSTSFNPRPDSGAAGPIPVGVQKPGEKISNTVIFTAT